jgi:ribosomal protein L16 Arg81 hydroxylase
MDYTKRADRQRRYLAGLRTSRNELELEKAAHAKCREMMNKAMAKVEALRSAIKDKETQIRQLQRIVATGGSDGGDDAELLRAIEEWDIETTMKAQ